MPSEKRSHGRITSGNSRPHKTARFGQESRDDDEDSANGGSDGEMLVDDEPFISAAPNYQSLNAKHDTPDTNMRVSQATVWPSSLAAVKNRIFYNLTPQDGPSLPRHIIQLVSSRILRPTSRDGPQVAPPNISYLHLGFTSFLDLQIFVFLPNLRPSTYPSHEPGRISETTLEKWTDTVFLPSVIGNVPRIPSSWRLANLYKRSPTVFDETVAPFATYKIYDSQKGQFFAKVWQNILDLSMRHPEFQHPFLLLYSAGGPGQTYPGGTPEKMMHSFETSWHEHVDMAYVDCPAENLKVDFEYGTSLEPVYLPMR